VVPKNDEAGAPARTGTAGRECLEGSPPLSTRRPDPASTIQVLAELFAVFIADWRKPHRPLKVGIHQDLVGRGLLVPDECRAVFRVYVGRRQYQKALAAGGPRYDLDGNAAGEVTAEQVDAAKTKLTLIKEKMKRREQSRPKAPPRAKQEPAAPYRLGLAALKAAAVARKADVVEAVNPAQAGGAE
jgi:sRNA-binding protein